MGWIPEAGSDADAIHDNVAGEISALSAVTPASGDLVLIEDASDSFNKKKVDVDDLVGSGSGGSAPEWVEALNARQVDETGHADDDFFTADSTGDYTDADVTGTSTWVVGRDLLSVLFNSQTSGDLSVFYKAFGSASAPMTIETRLKFLTSDLNNPAAGILFTDGSSSTSNNYGVGTFGTSGVHAMRIGKWSGTLTAGGLTTVQEIFGTDSPIYLRAIWVSSNSFAWSMSPDGVSWTDFAQSNDAKTMTPTGLAFFVSTNGTTGPFVASFDYVRVYDADLSV